jgi:hypothetical protein
MPRSLESCINDTRNALSMLDQGVTEFAIVNI